METLFCNVGEFRHFSVRIRHVTEPDKTLRTARTFSRQVNLYTSQSVRENQRTQAFCEYATFIHEAPDVLRRV